MDAELKAKWVEALRSGEYRQCQGRLERDGGYCCLGVLAKVAGMEAEIRDENYAPLDKLIGADDTNRRRSTLVHMNDGDGPKDEPGYVPPKPFSEIADYIEREL